MTFKFIPKVRWHSFFEVALDSIETSSHNGRTHSKDKNVVVWLYQVMTVLVVIQKSQQKPV